MNVKLSIIKYGFWAKNTGPVHLCPHKIQNTLSYNTKNDATLCPKLHTFYIHLNLKKCILVFN